MPSFILIRLTFGHNTGVLWPNNKQTDKHRQKHKAERRVGVAITNANINLNINVTDINQSINQFIKIHTSNVHASVQIA